MACVFWILPSLLLLSLVANSAKITCKTCKDFVESFDKVRRREGGRVGCGEGRMKWGEGREARMKRGGKDGGGREGG